jgi:ribosomal protein L12E/L44/L45/RPP1/RPP2
MHKALAALPRAQKTARTPRYEDTNRYLRGRVLARLREEADPEGLPLPELARLLQRDGADVEPIGLMAVVESLERDGLARVTPLSERSAGHPAGAGAEERAPYAAGEKREDPTEIRLSLA